MNTPRAHKRTALLALSLLLLLIGLSLTCILWVRREQRQYTLNRQLIEALKKNDTTEALELVEAGADPSSSFKPPPTPTWRERIQQFLHPSPRSNIQADESPTAFLVACGAYWYLPDGEHVLLTQVPENPPLIRAMLTHGAKLHEQTYSEESPLLIAVYNYRRSTVKLLLEYGADANERAWHGGRTLLMDSAMFQDPVIMQLILAHGAKVNAQDSAGKTVLHYAVSFRRENIIPLLLEHGADPNLADNDGKTPLTLAKRWSPDIIPLLRKYDKNP